MCIDHHCEWAEMLSKVMLKVTQFSCVCVWEREWGWERVCVFSDKERLKMKDRAKINKAYADKIRQKH